MLYEVITCAEVYRLPFPNYYRYNQQMSLDDFAEWQLKRLRESAHNVVDPDNVAAIIIV